jgi:hypothetical protein
MKFRSVMFRCAACLVLAAAAAPAGAAESPKSAASKLTTTTAKPEAIKTDPAQDAMMAEMAKYAAPGPMHKRLESMVGTWKCTVKAWMAPGEPMVSEGTSVNTLVLGGRYLAQDFTSTMMDQPFQGWGLTGYDNRKQQFTGLWIDNTSTAMMTQTGSLNAKGDELVFKGTTDGPDGKPMDVRMVTKFVDDKKHVFSMYAPMQGKETLMMEITYTKQ